MTMVTHNMMSAMLTITIVSDHFSGGCQVEYCGKSLVMSVMNGQPEQWCVMADNV